MSEEGQQTCGKGLAEHAIVAATLGALADAMADNLEAHQEALDVTDENARKELHAYVKLTAEFRGIANQLTATAGHMAAYRDLPMGRHDPRAMAAPKAVEAFKHLVRVEEDLQRVLATLIQRHQAILGAASSHPR
jgi:hypothetical protein